MTGVLVHDTVERLQQIVDDCSQDKPQHEKATGHIQVWRNFLKHQYDSHVRKDNDKVDTHGIDFGLKKLKPENQHLAESREEDNFLLVILVCIYSRASKNLL